MKQFDFPKWNKILGWVAFGIALVVFTLTVEPTVSFWDVGEYISTSTKLEVGHPPGAPLFQMIGAFFSNFTTDESQIALMVNMMSVFSSAFTILFMFWTISLLLRKIIGDYEKNTLAQNIAILGGAFIGSVSFAFTDSFWFNAGEAEVYAMAAFFMAVLFYVGLLWERDMFKPRGNRWLILISFIVGLSFGVHFMALLTIPAIGYLYFFKKYKDVTVKNFIVATLIVVGSLMFVFKLLLPYTLTFFAVSEIFFTNSLGLPFNSGTIIAFVAIILFFVYSLRHTRRKHYVTANSILHCVLFILIGFSCWMMLPIRANAGTTINENNPSDARSLLAYYNREQYGETHLFYGAQFTDVFAGLNENDPYTDGKPFYERNYKSGKYEIVNEYENTVMNPHEDHKTLFPRMWDPSKADNYLNFTGPLEVKVRPEYQQHPELTQAVSEIQHQFQTGQVNSEEYLAFLKKFSDYITVKKPDFWDNISFFWEYQVKYMYFRYFMWNFVGRQNDLQGYMDDLNGNWISGINFIDELFLPPQDNLPSDMKNNPARNTYYFLPFILGIIGLFFHFNRDKKSFWVLMVFFLFTSIALVVYLNQNPFQPRERDYALVGSFYVFAIWMGYGVYAIFNWLQEHIKPRLAAPIVCAVCLVVPGILLAQNWDDHDRSGRYTALAMGKKYLDSVAENAILFTIGDNDTFLLWYLQEVEGYRRDVRVLNTQLLYTPWYIDQAKWQAYEGAPVKTTLEHADYNVGKNEAIIYQDDPRMPDTMTVQNWLQYVKSDHPSTQSQFNSGQTVNLYPAKNLRLPVNKQNVLDSGIVKPEDADEIVPYIDLELPNIIYKNRLIMLDIVANTDWKRPIYFTGGSFTDADYLWMSDYLQLDGVCYKLVPIKTEHQSFFDMGRIDADLMYDIVMGWKWGNSESDEIYHHPPTRRNSITYRSNMGRLVEELLKEGDTMKAKTILDLGMEKMPLEHYGHYTLLDPFISGYYEIGEKEKAREIWNQIVEKYQEELDWYSTWDRRAQNRNFDEISTTIYKYRSLVDLLVVNQDDEIAEEKIAEFNDYMEKFLPPEEAPSFDEMRKDTDLDSVEIFTGEDESPSLNQPDGVQPVKELPVDTSQ